MGKSIIHGIILGIAITASANNAFACANDSILDRNPDLNQVMGPEKCQYVAKLHHILVNPAPAKVRIRGGGILLDCMMLKFLDTNPDLANGWRSNPHLTYDLLVGVEKTSPLTYVYAKKCAEEAEKRAKRWWNWSPFYP